MSVLCVAVLAANSARTALGPLQETMSHALGLTDNQMALLQGPALALPVALFAVPLGAVIDRHSRVRLVSILILAVFAGTIITAASTSFHLLFLARCIVGVAATAVFTAVLSLVADLYMPEKRGRATMAVAISQVLGVSVTFALGGELITRVDPGRESWRWALCFLATPVLPTILLMSMAREPRRTGVGVSPPSFHRSLSELWQYRNAMAPLLLGMVMVETALGAVLVWTAPALSRQFSLTSGRVGMIVSLSFLLSGICGPVLGGVLADICQRSGGPHRSVTTLCGLILLAAPAAFFSYGLSLNEATALLVLFMTIITGAAVMGTTLFTVAIPNELRGLCMAAMTAVSVFFAVGLAPLAVSLLSGALGGPAMIGQSLTAIGICACLLAAGSFRVCAGSISAQVQIAGGKA